MDDNLPPLPEWQHLKQYGYAPGNYMNRCAICQQVVCDLDKRAITCRACAEHQHAAPQVISLQECKQILQNAGYTVLDNFEDKL